ncbi:putative F-box protein At5g55150 [Rhodamnia argentea]|uniref:F-box protein At5g55150 n=1 Tax=Rhodamnia argentea TaxID=178133 RepID=A0A8B8QRX9_9MYRT|nr:putative F-box protein At5g55150 [Rhodamnia argentea]
MAGYRPENKESTTLVDRSGLPSHALEFIAYRLPTEDLIDFSQTCSYWRNVVVQLRGSFELRISVPWLLIMDQTRPDLCGFFSPRRRSFYEFPLPQVRGRRCLSSRGWIMTIGSDRDVQMFNPLPRGRARTEGSASKPQGLPITDRQIGKFVLSTCPSSSAQPEIMVLCDSDRRLGLWNYRDNAWTMVSPDRIYMDLIYHECRFLAVDAIGTIRAFEAKQDGPNPATDGRVVARRPRGLIDFKRFKKHYLVEWSGSLLVVTQEWQDEFETSGFQAFLLDLEASTWTKVDSLGNTSLFLGLNSSFSMEVTDQHGGIEPNCIYFTDDRTYKLTKGEDMGIYHMADGRIEPLFGDGTPVCPNSTPLWIEPQCGVSEDY